MVAKTVIRLLTQADVPVVQALSHSAGWNQTETDWRLLLAMQPDGCFGMEYDGTVVATTTVVCYGDTLAWIGMVLTAEPYRGRGFARELLTTALDMAARKSVQTVKLDATDMGKPLYESLGFTSEQPIGRWLREGAVIPDPLCRNATSAVVTSDIGAFGADRNQLLQQLSRNGTVIACNDGFVITRPGARAGYIGPCIASTPGIAENLIRSVVAGSQYWDFLDGNAMASHLATKLGFVKTRQLTRMYRGRALAPPDELQVFAIAGFEWG